MLTTHKSRLLLHMLGKIFQDYLLHHFPGDWGEVQELTRWSPDAPSWPSWRWQWSLFSSKPLKNHWEWPYYASSLSTHGCIPSHPTDLFLSILFKHCLAFVREPWFLTMTLQVLVLPCACTVWLWPATISALPSSTAEKECIYMSCHFWQCHTPHIFICLCDWQVSICWNSLTCLVSEQPMTACLFSSDQEVLISEIIYIDIYTQICI